jgi:hypothetical protein
MFVARYRRWMRWQVDAKPLSVSFKALAVLGPIRNPAICADQHNAEHSAAGAFNRHEPSSQQVVEEGHVNRGRFRRLLGFVQQPIEQRRVDLRP